MNPLISIIVPCYNYARYLDECLQSVLDQTFQHWECIIINDGSPDDTEEVAIKWVDKDSRFRYLKQQNKGVSAARNLGIANAKGEWILPLDSDNLIFPEYLKLAEERFQDNFKIITCGIQRFGLENDIWNLPEFNLEKLASVNMIENCSFFRKTDWEFIGGYDVGLIYGYEDWDFWISMLQNGGAVLKLDYVGLNYRVKEVSRNKELLQNDRLDITMKYIEKKHFDFFARYFKNWHYYHSQYILIDKKYKSITQNIIGKILKKLIDLSKY